MKAEEAKSQNYQRVISTPYLQARTTIESDINAFYDRFASREGITRAEAQYRAEEMELRMFSRKVQKYVEEKDMSPEANAFLKDYNLKGRVSREELLRHRVDLALHELGVEEERIIGEQLDRRFDRSLEFETGIWAMSVPEVDTLKAMSEAITNMPFYDATWSERIWERQNKLRDTMGQNIHRVIMQGRNSTVLISELRSMFNVSEYEAKRLLVTETARVQTETQRQLMLYNDYEKYIYLTESEPCDLCRDLADKIFDVKDMVPTENAPPMHPNCKCATSPYVEEDIPTVEEQRQTEQESIEDLRRRTKERMDSSDFRKTLTKAQYKQFMEEFDSIEDRQILQMYHDYVEEIGYRRGGNQSFYSPYYDRVTIKPDSTHPTRERRQQFGVIHHEMGHAFDSKLFEKLMGTKVGYDSQGRVLHELSAIPEFDLSNKILRDYENNILNRNLRELGPEPPKMKNGTFNDEYDQWDIDRTYNEITKKNNLDEFIKEYKEYGSKSRENQSTMAALSDILESTGQTPEYPIGWGHGEDYYKQNHTMRTAEFFAHATQLRAHNEEGYGKLKEFFPESTAAYEKMINQALGDEEEEEMYDVREDRY